MTNRESSRVVRWGMIGCGDVTELKSGPAFRKARGSALVAVMRRNAEKAKDYAFRHGVPKWYADADELIRDPEVDVIYVATPPSSHKEYTIAAARAGKPVYVEKPMARTHGECLEMVEACSAAAVPLFVAYYRRLLPRFLKVKEIIDSGRLGDIRFVRIALWRPVNPLDQDRSNPRWRVIPEIAGGGHFVDLAPHTLDLLDYFLGPITSVRGTASNQGNDYEAEDLVTGEFQFASGAQGTGVWCFNASDSHDSVDIVGSAGRLCFSTFDETPVVFISNSGNEEHVIPHPDHVQQPLIQSVVDELNRIGKCPSTGETGARTSWVMDQMLESYRRITLGSVSTTAAGSTSGNPE